MFGLANPFPVLPGGAFFTRCFWYIIISVLTLVGTAEETIEGVWTVRLRSCYLDYHTNIHAVALACPGVDYIRLWPLPVTQPWGDPTDTGPGWYAWQSWREDREPTEYGKLPFFAVFN